MKTKRKTPNRKKSQAGVFILGRPTKNISFMSMGVKPRPLKKNEFNKAPLKGLNIVNVRSPNIYNISPRVKRPVRDVRPFSMIIKKESTSQKAPLSKWGDADMDGTVNFLDCSPRNIANDGFFGDMVNKVKGAFTKDNEPTVHDPIDKIAKNKEYQDRVKIRQAEAEIAFDKDLNQREQGIVASQTKKEYIDELKAAQEEKDKGKMKKETQKKRLLAPLKTLSNMLPTNILAKNVNPNTGRYIKHSSLEPQKRLAGNILNTISEILPGEERLVGARRPYGTVKSKKVAKSKRPVGRPKGSFKHYIPGVGLVSGDRYDKWEKVQKLKGAGAQGGPPLRTTQPTNINMQPKVMTAEAMPVRPMSENSPVKQPEAIRSTYTPEDQIKAIQLYQQRNDNVLNVERLQAPNIMKNEMVGTNDGDNILNAPNINKGGMRSMYKDPNRLEAPNMMKGEMKTGSGRIEAGTRVGTADANVVHRPQAQPYGDESLDVEPGSGNTIVKRRVYERWSQAQDEEDMNFQN